MEAVTADRSEVPKRFELARRWQWPAAVVSAAFVLSCFIGWPFGYFWPSAIGLAVFIPAATLFSIKCDACGFPAFQDHKADERLRLDNRFWTRFWGKEYRGLQFPLRAECSKSGTRFVHVED